MSLGYALVVLVVYTLAVARVVKLINNDTVLDPLRIMIARAARDTATRSREAYSSDHTKTGDALAARAERINVLSYFMGCPWCVAPWIAAATLWVPLYHHHNPVARYVILVLAVAHVVGLLAPLADTDDIAIVEDESVGGGD